MLFFLHFQKPKAEKVDHYRPQGEEFDKAYTYDYKSRTDGAEVPQQQVTTERISVSRRDLTRMEETEKLVYPKSLDIGRIVIEETPEDKEEILKRGDFEIEHVRPKSTDATVTKHEVEEHPKTYVTEDVIKVGKLDVTHLEKEVVEAKTVKERINAYRDRVDGARKVN